MNKINIVSLLYVLGWIFSCLINYKKNLREYEKTQNVVYEYSFTDEYSALLYFCFSLIPIIVRKFDFGKRNK